ITTNTIEAEFTNLVPITKALNWVRSMLNNFNVNLSLNKVNRILYTNSNNAKDRVLNPNILAKNQYINI
ncbi:hypothetical protein QBC45DRAFT_317774, partial [Copromyces sp. CBS 386.78]